MSTAKLAIKLRITQESYQEIHRLHPGYGESQRIIRELVENYLAARKATKREVDAIAEAVLGKVR